MHIRLMFPTDYVTAADLGGVDKTVTVASVVQEKLTMQGGVTEDAWILSFNEAKKKLVLNKTNAKLIAAHHGEESDDWIGKQITLYATQCKFGRDTVDCIRVRGKSSPFSKKA